MWCVKSLELAELQRRNLPQTSLLSLPAPGRHYSALCFYVFGYFCRKIKERRGEGQESKKETERGREAGKGGARGAWGGREGGTDLILGLRSAPPCAFGKAHTSPKGHLLPLNNFPLAWGQEGRLETGDGDTGTFIDPK